MTTLIADSGATKADWRAVHPDGTIRKIITSGINPVFLSCEEICTLLVQELCPSLEGNVGAIHFYAAGITGEAMAQQMQACFTRIFPQAVSTAHSDMVAAMRALCGNRPGIACILGTGSNSCFYDGKNMAPDKVPAGGFILGDEGGGAVLGRKLLSDFIKRQLPDNLDRAFRVQYPHVNMDLIIQKVYREPIPSRFLATFAPFLNQHRHDPHIDRLLRSSFADFFSRNIAQYDYRHYPVNIVGSIGYFFKELIDEEAQKQGMTLGKVLQAPIEGLLEYHTQIPT